MAYKPTPAGPRDIREMFHYLWKELTAVGAAIGTGGGTVASHNDLNNRDAAGAHPISAITNLDTTLRTLVVAGYGGIRLATPVAIGPGGVIGAGWTTLIADSTAVDTPRLVTQAPGTNSISLDYNSVWQFSVSVILAHNEDPSGARTTFLRFTNTTQGVSSAGIPISVGRNSPTTNYASTSMFTTVAAGDSIVAEIGGGDDLSSAQLIGYSFTANNLGVYKG